MTTQYTLEEMLLKLAYVGIVQLKNTGHPGPWTGAYNNGNQVTVTTGDTARDVVGFLFLQAFG